MVIDVYKEEKDVFDNVEAVPRKILPMFFLIDTSGSMAGEKIGSLNSAMEEVMLELRSMSAGNSDAEIKIAVMEFSSGCSWLTPGLVSVENYGDWQTLKAGGVTDMGAACLELDKRLSRKDGGYMVTPSGSFAPVIYIMSDGIPVDDFDKGLEQLKQNKWFRASMKIALAIGSDADEKLLESFTGNCETVVTVHNKEELTKMIKLMAVTSAAIGSRSRGIGEPNKTADPTILEPTVGMGELGGAIQEGLPKPEPADPSADSDPWAW